MRRGPSRHTRCGFVSTSNFMEGGTRAISAFLRFGIFSHMVVEKQVSASTQNQALGALKFLYASVLRKPLDSTPEIGFAARARRLPIVLSAGEVRAVLGQLRDPERLVVSLLYGSGLRIMECVSLRVKDVDVVRREIVVRGGKGNKDRRAPLAESAVADMRRALRRALTSAGVWTIGRMSVLRESTERLGENSRPLRGTGSGITCFRQRGLFAILPE